MQSGGSDTHTGRATACILDFLSIEGLPRPVPHVPTALFPAQPVDPAVFHLDCRLGPAWCRFCSTRRDWVSLLAAAQVSVSVLCIAKSWSQASCPWDVKEFVRPETHVSHRAWGIADGGAGRCFPAGHASAAFCFMAGCFRPREKARLAAVTRLVTTLLAGLTIGLAQ